MDNEQEVKAKEIKKTVKKVVLRRVSGVYVFNGIKNVKVVSSLSDYNGASWFPVVGDLADTYTIELKEFKNLNKV